MLQQNEGVGTRKEKTLTQEMRSNPGRGQRKAQNNKKGIPRAQLGSPPLETSLD